MVSEATYISKEIAEKIKDASVLEDVVMDYVTLKPSGSAMLGDCPNCGKAKKLNVHPKKKIWKCFSCEEGGKTAVDFLMKTQGMTYVQSLQTLADRYNIIIEESKTTKKERPSRKISFRDKQLRESGISINKQKWQLNSEDKNNTSTEMDRYQSGTVDKFWNVIPGDDMVLHYLDLEGKPLVYRTEKGARKSVIRIRYSNPALRKDKEGKPIKYKSPPKSGSHLWIPNRIIEAYKGFEILDTLYITEGEKKADKMCLHGLPTVGIMGIHNFGSGGEMPYHFEGLIKRCGIANVVFVLDSDWQDISTKNPQRSVDIRPKTFFKAVERFKDYFKAYYTEGIEIETYFAHGKDAVHKGIDDLLVHKLKGTEEVLKEDFTNSLLSRDGEGRYVNVYKISEMSTYKLKEFWHLHSIPAFLNAHKEELKKLREFQLGQLKRRWNEDKQEFELADKILPNEQYWKKIYDGENKLGEAKFKYQFDYANSIEFLRNRGFGLYEYSEDKFRFVHVIGKVIRQIDPHKIQRYVMDFTRQLDKEDSKPVLELLLRGGRQYLGPDRLSQMYYLRPQFNEAEKDCQFLYFKNCFWKITPEEIIQRPLSELPKHVWSDKIIDFEPEYLGSPMCKAVRKGDKWRIGATDEMHKCDIAQFYSNTSNFHWRKEQELREGDDGRKYYIDKPKAEKITDEDLDIFHGNLISKMLAAGYVMHEYKDYGNMKAVVGMDGVESEVGKSQGGTGKSIWGKQFQHLVPQEILDGKKKNIEDDNHLYENVDERTQVILFDDVRVNFNFEFLFSQITTGVTVNPKGEKRYNILPPKFIVLTNHSLNGEGNSFDRRQYTIAFSDYYNKDRTAGDEFGHQLFHEWDNEQWNLFYNFMATCIQLFLKHGLDYTIPQSALERRKLRQQLGEDFIEWASLVYAPDGGFLNNRVEKVFACEHFLDQFPQNRKFVNPRKFKEKLRKYADYAGLSYNPLTNGGRLKANAKEYFILANDDFDSNDYRIITHEGDLSNPSPASPFS